MRGNYKENFQKRKQLESKNISHQVVSGTISDKSISKNAGNKAVYELEISQHSTKNNPSKIESSKSNERRGSNKDGELIPPLTNPLLKKKSSNETRFPNEDDDFKRTANFSTDTSSMKTLQNCQTPLKILNQFEDDKMKTEYTKYPQGVIPKLNLVELKHRPTTNFDEKLDIVNLQTQRKAESSMNPRKDNIDISSFIIHEGEEFGQGVEINNSTFSKNNTLIDRNFNFSIGTTRVINHEDSNLLYPLYEKNVDFVVFEQTVKSNNNVADPLNFQNEHLGISSKYEIKNSLNESKLTVKEVTMVNEEGKENFSVHYAANNSVISAPYNNVDTERYEALNNTMKLIQTKKNEKSRESQQSNKREGADILLKNNKFFIKQEAFKIDKVEEFSFLHLKRKDSFLDKLEEEMDRIAKQNIVETVHFHSFTPSRITQKRSNFLKDLETYEVPTPINREKALKASAYKTENRRLRSLSSISNKSNCEENQNVKKNKRNNISCEKEKPNLFVQKKNIVKKEIPGKKFSQNRVLNYVPKNSILINQASKSDKSTVKFDKNMKISPLNLKMVERGNQILAEKILGQRKQNLNGGKVIKMDRNVLEEPTKESKYRKASVSPINVKYYK